jgi:hypothetical protein
MNITQDYSLTSFARDPYGSESKEKACHASHGTGILHFPLFLSHNLPLPLLLEPCALHPFHDYSLTSFARDPGGGVTKRKSLPCFAWPGLCFSFMLPKASFRRTEKTKPGTLCQAFSFVGVAGFEPATLWSQTRCANRAALHPENEPDCLPG